MYSTLPENSSASLRSMVGIEARRFAKHPVFLLGAIAAFAFTALQSSQGDDAHDLLIQTTNAAFFIGVFGIIVAARLVRSTDAANEAMAALPGTEARRTLAVAGACVVPFVAGLLWLAEILGFALVRGVHENELWFGTMNDLYVWSILIGLGPVACLGGPLLGVLVARWLRFRGASAIAVVVVVFACVAGASLPGVSRLWLPWVLFSTGSWTGSEVEASKVDAALAGVSGMEAGNPAFYLLYVLVLCALAIGGAMWHDRTARTPRLRLINWGLIGVGAVAVALAMTTGPDEKYNSEPIPWVAEQ